MKKQQVRQSFLSGAFTLVCATVVVKIIGAIYKIPLYNILMTQGTGYYSTAYSIYMPIYVLATAGLPAAVSRMVSEQYSVGNCNNIRRILKIALAFFLATGTAGTAIMLAFPSIIPESLHLFDPQASYAIRALAPTLLFVCLMSAFRGYYEGLRNMYPTSVSQVLEAVCKLVFGLIFADGAIRRGVSDFEAGRSVYGTQCFTEQQALEASYPLAAAGAIAGVTLGAFFGLCFLIARHKAKGDGISAEMLEASAPADSNKKIFRLLLKIAVPVALSAIALNLSAMIDNFTINSRLTMLTEKYPEYISGVFADVLNTTGPGAGSLEKLPNYLWGLYSYGLVFYNLVPIITTNFGISALPAITASWTVGDTRSLHENIERAIRVVALIAYPAALGLAILSDPILRLFYSRPLGSAGIRIAVPLLQILSATLLFGSLCTTLGSILQGLGKPAAQVKAVFAGIALKIIVNTALVSVPSLNIIGAPIGTFACYSLIFFIEIFIIRRVSGIRLDFRKTFLKPILCAAICAAAAFGVKTLCEKVLSVPVIVTVALSIAAAAVIYLVSLLLLRAVDKNDLLSFPGTGKLAAALEKRGLLG